MAPLLWEGDWALTVPARRVAVGDLVVIEHPRRPGFEMVKRIMAAPGDLDPSGDPLGTDGWWVEGDNSGESTDSRHFGPIARTDIIAHVRLVYWPPHRRRLV